MSHWFQKPENALKRAHELLAIPNADAGVIKRTKRSALEILHDALVAKKNRTWQPTHEDLMRLYLDICLDLHLGRVAKDGLHQYRNLSIQLNPASLETIIEYFVSQAERRLAAAKQESNELNLLAAAKVDLDAAQTPEDVMLSTTTFEGSSDRRDREVVVPWLRFMWETYRTVLDILKANSKLEGLYKSIALKAFDFCVEYQRKIEFRRVCEIMRNHLGALQKHSANPTSQSTRQMRSWEGFTLEGVERLLEVRYRQLQVATDLELFSEAFRTIDDINTVMNLVEQTPRVELLVTYYEKLAQIFQVSKNHLFHAYALYKWYSLRVVGLQGLAGSQALTQLPVLVSAEEQSAMATRVVLAALSIPLLDFEAAASVLDADAAAASAQSADSSLSAAARDKNSRMAALLGFATTPTRANLLEDIEAAGLLPKADTFVSEIFSRVEQHEVDPLLIVQQLQPFLTELRAQPLAKTYVNSVERLVVRRVLFQLTRVYSSVTIAHLRSLFVGLDVSYAEIETLIARSRSLSTVAYASAPSLTSMYRRNVTQHGSNSAESSSANSASASGSASRTKIRIDHVQQCIRFSDAVELEANAAQLTLLGERLTRAMAKAPALAQPAAEQQAAQKTKLFAATRARLQQQRKAMLERREVIERKKEELEKLQQEKQQTLEAKRLELAARRTQVERERLAQEAQRREAEKKQKIQDEIKLKETRSMLEKLGHTDVKDEDLATIDKDKVMNEAKEKARKAKEEAQRKLKEQSRRLDYIVRATREEEQPILQRQFADTKAKALQQHEEEAAAKLQRAKEEHAHGLEEKARLAPALTVAASFVEAHKARRLEQYKKASEEQKKKAMLERLSERVEHAKERYEDEQRAIREEEEEQERLRREEEEEKERQRQEEIEEELRRQEEEEAEERRIAEEKEREERQAREREAEEKGIEARSQGRFGSAGASGLGGGLRRGPSRGRGEEEEEDGEWTHVSRGASSARAPPPAPEGRWERRGPAPAPRDSSREGPREGGLRGAFRGGMGDREGGGLRRGFGGDREEGGGLRRGFGGDREEGGGLRRGFGGDREEGGGLRRGFGGDREEGGGLRRGFGGDRGAFGGDRRGDREEGGSRWGNREGGSSFRRGGDRDGGDRESSFRRGGDRDGERESSFRRGGDREGGDDRFFGRREGAYRPPRAGDREAPAREAREPARAPDSGRWR